MCLRGVMDSGCPDARLTVYDVASTDGSADWLAEHYPRVRVVTLKKNLGPNPARNLAIRQSETPFVVVMDADVQLMPDTVPGLWAVIGEDERIGVATPVVLYADRPDTVQYSRTHVHFLAEASADRDDKLLTQLQGKTARVGLASGCAPLIRRSAAEDVGMFEERYFFGKTDGEFSYRIALGGWHIVEPAGARVLHHHHVRGSKYYMHQVRNRWHFILKNYQLRTLLAMLPVLVLHEPALFLLLLVKGKPGEYIRALVSLCALLPTLSDDRGRVALSRRVHDWQVLRGDRLVTPGEVKNGTFGSMVSAYSVVLDLYWRAARSLLSAFSGPSEREGIPAEDSTASASSVHDESPVTESHINAA